MKRIYLILQSLFFVAALCVGFTSCNSEDDDELYTVNKLMSKKWVYTDTGAGEWSEGAYVQSSSYCLYFLDGQYGVNSWYEKEVDSYFGTDKESGYDFFEYTIQGNSIVIKYFEGGRFDGRKQTFTINGSSIKSDGDTYYAQDYNYSEIRNLEKELADKLEEKTYESSVKNGVLATITVIDKFHRELKITTSLAEKYPNRKIKYIIGVEMNLPYPYKDENGYDEYVLNDNSDLCIGNLFQLKANPNDYIRIYDGLIKKINSGASLTSSEEELYNEIIPIVKSYTHNMDFSFYVEINGERFSIPTKYVYVYPSDTPDNGNGNNNTDDKIFTVGGVSFTMKKVTGGTFTMGATSEQGSDAQYDEKTTHQVTLSSYYIGETEVTQALWEAVMGSNPSYFKGSNLPVEQVSWNDCQEFITKLNAMTGQKFRLPTEAEWEYAARGGNKSKGYKYSGSKYQDYVAWYDSYRPYPVKTKHANELGIYDMSGNVSEWCSDWYGSYSSNAQTNPTGPSTGSYRVNRGGGYYDDAGHCRVSDRLAFTPDLRLGNRGLRLACSDVTAGGTPENSDVKIVTNSATGDITCTLGSVSFMMKPVAGGTFTMGATSEQGSDALDNEKPTHRVTLSSYYIGETEVTQALWQAVMGSNPSSHNGSNLPVERVSWNDCQEFVTKLNAMTGQKFRLPTEAEWEFAARGGNKSKGYKYIGSNNIGEVAWYAGNSDTTQPVKTKQPNELGIYDMSGNVEEWCNDWYGDYSSNSQTNPAGPSTGSNRVRRGGCWDDSARFCRVSYRFYSTPGLRSNYLGLRLAL